MKDAEELGAIADSLDAVAHAMLIPMPPQMHLDILKSTLPLVVERIRQLYVKETGADPWGE